MMKSEQHDPTTTSGSPTSTRRRTMMKSEQNLTTTTTTTNPGSTTSSVNQSDHHSDLTDSTKDDEDFITLLQYKDAYHILNLSKELSSSSSSSPIPPEQIQAAYESAKEQVLTALDQCEASEKKQSNNGRKQQRMFFMSQQNYLELKLQALDQAYEELMPMEAVNVVHQNEIQNETAANHLVDREKERAASTRDTMDAPSFHKGLEREAPSVETGSRQFLGNDTSTAAVKSGCQTTSPQQHRRLPSDDDELDTIDIYFRPSPGQYHNSSDTRPPPRPKSPENPSDMSSITWDSSSIFSIVSKTKQNLEEASVGGLSEVLGPIYNSSPTMSVSTPPQTSGVKTIPTATTTITTTTTNQNVHNRRNRHSRNLPPLAGVDNTAKQENPKGPQISPKSIMEFPPSSSAAVVPSSSSTRNNNNNDEHYNDVGRVETMQESRIAHTSSSSARRRHRHRHNSNAATEAARMGILRALSEDNSECLPLDDDIDHNYLNLSNDDTNANSLDRSQLKSKCNKERGGVSKSRRFFQGKSDSMPKETNSLMASVLDDKPKLYDPTTNREQSDVALLPQCSNAAVAPKSVSSSSASSSRRKGKLTTTTTTTATTTNTPQQPNNYEDLLQSSQYSYDAILQSGMEFADELCLALGSCWNGGEVGYSAAAASAFAAASPERRVTTSRFRRGDDDESTHFTRSTYGHDNDDSTYHTQSVLTGLTGAEDSLTAFNTTSSFSRRTEDSSDLNEGRRGSSPVTIMSSDPPPRMLV